MRFVELEIEARQCADLDKLRLAIVNATARLVDYDQAFLIEPGLAGGWTITRASSLAKFDRHAPVPSAIGRWLGHAENARSLAKGEIKQVDLDRDCAEWGIDVAPFAFPKGLWIPLRRRDGNVVAGLLALRSEAWPAAAVVLLTPLAGAYAHAWEALMPQAATRSTRARRFVSKRRLALALAVVVAVAAVIPVPMSALAPAEIVAATPSLVTAPIDGVVGEILLPPGSWIARGQPVLKLVDIKLRSDVEVAHRNLAVAQANYFRVVQSSTATQKNLQELATTRAEYDVSQAELRYAEQLLSRAVVTAPTSGLLIYSARSDLIGKPVRVGERLMEIGDPEHTEIKIELPVSDAVALEPGGAVALFLDGDPMQAIRGTITRVSYRPALSAQQQLVYRVFASFTSQQARSIGLRGVARVSSADVPLGLYLFRRPISALRQWIGL
ncbi:MAG: HlyD family efflux transporter periplasmic adaptor subunit [Hyphomicrobiaceae bacterium]